MFVIQAYDTPKQKDEPLAKPVWFVSNFVN
jgi:hypothetical protein